MKTRTIKPALLDKGHRVVTLGPDLEMTTRRVKYISRVAERGRIRAYRVTFEYGEPEIYPVRSKVEIFENEPVVTDERICFGIHYFRTEAEADAFAEDIVAAGRTYNGGYLHGKPCGREPSRDFDHPEHGRIYAVTC